MLEAVPLVAGLDESAVLHQSVAYRGGPLRRAELPRPFREAKVGGEEVAGAVVED